MKVIELFLRCWERDSTLPQKIRYEGKDFNKSATEKYIYYVECGTGKNFMEYIRAFNRLRDEVEVLGKDKEIEELPKYADVDEKTGLACGWSFQEEKLKDKINELIKEVNKIKKG
jgi:predicted house-cleaning noncanonical NTP pyrophosphatase (MazG superfamily)